MMMTANRSSARRSWSAQLAPEPELYFEAAMRTLIMARALYRWRLIGRRGMMVALRWSDALSRAGMQSWRDRRRRFFG